MSSKGAMLMFKTTLSAVRRATLVGVGAVSLALGVPVIPPATSSDAGISAPAVHDSNSVPLEHEHVVNWSDYEVTGDHEITFSVPTGTATCFDVRAEAAESNGTLHVATVEGSVLGAPDKCTMEGRTVKVRVYTNAPASSLKVQQLPASQVTLHE